MFLACSNALVGLSALPCLPRRYLKRIRGLLCGASKNGGEDPVDHTGPHELRNIVGGPQKLN